MRWFFLTLRLSSNLTSHPRLMLLILSFQLACRRAGTRDGLPPQRPRLDRRNHVEIHCFHRSHSLDSCFFSSHFISDCGAHLFHRGCDFQLVAFGISESCFVIAAEPGFLVLAKMRNSLVTSLTGGEQLFNIGKAAMADR